MTSDMITKYVKSSHVSHASESGLWEEMSKHMREYELMLMPVFFLDEWKPHKHQKGQVTGIYMSLSNSQGVRIYYLPVENSLECIFQCILKYTQRFQIYLVGIIDKVPKKYHQQVLFKVIDKVLVEPTIQLKNGVSLNTYVGVKKFCGTIHSILGGETRFFLFTNFKENSKRRTEAKHERVLRNFAETPPYNINLSEVSF